jgi:cytochrome c oxidase subunit 2
MKSRFALIGRLAAGISSAVLGVAVAGQVLADAVGQPTPGGIALQPGGSDIRDKVDWFHNWLLLPIITAIALFVLVLLLIVMVRFNRRANPTPARWSHNTPIEIVWTVVPVMILMTIAIFSFRLLYQEHDMGQAKPDVVVKVTGRQWNWDYEYPDLRVSAFTSTVLDEKTANAKHVPYLLATSAPLIAPVGKVVQLQVTGEDVIHSFSIPAFGVKIDAVPGRLNQAWFKANAVGTYYGQCSQLCGVDHAFMPIEIKVVSQADFDAWVASKAKPAPPAPAPAAAPAAAAPAAPAAAAPAPAATASAAPAPAAAPAAPPAATPAAKR